ncbi:transcriptional regulator, BadM/Rrf2 family [Solidesulfovibrio carbinoliphilus subsp. oakridgensis]|uniref:Transcriptional regulator, BadM/Rrf2 family n=1 Tax=Solidesulfovibrio carbinoliphilus subsp. oakridgensis TaxID=694327 RepID=G7QBW5_9BACT|nr:Rrf2 family transcriptional regulator [Solidesulfovibrio carbinoliphilus]EHJ49458.1 transcriptional regulator, BadM/Rrf2 family [Solidesulfovibrio carbinoliphilus subsp. oakridgensis]
MQLTTRSRYGLRMLIDIALHGSERPVRIQDIAKRRNISVKYLEQLIRALKKAGFIHSKRGPKGGHILAMAPEDIRVGDVVRALEVRPELTECVGNPDACLIASDCVTRQIWARATASLFKELDAIHVSDLLVQARKSEILGLPCC